MRKHRWWLLRVSLLSSVFTFLIFDESSTTFMLLAVIIFAIASGLLYLPVAWAELTGKNIKSRTWGLIYTSGFMTAMFFSIAWTLH